MTWPFLISVPHAGTSIPDEIVELNLLTREEIADDGDAEAGDIYLPLAENTLALQTTPIARAFVDQNRAEDDRHKDGVIKTHTCWDVPIYRRPLGEDEIERLLANHYRPYHHALVQRAAEAKLGIDGHTMSAQGPPVGPDPGVARPHVCLGNAHGNSCDPAWLEMLAGGLRDTLTDDVAINVPFSGGFITRSRPGGIPWLQIELARGPWAPVERKREGIREALQRLADALR